MSMSLVDVETPSGHRFEHHAVRYPQPAVGTLIVVDGQVLLLWRHRFITDSWGWEIPAGRIEAGETIAGAAHRETLEETGWAPGPTTSVMTWHPTNGSADAKFHVERATSATHVGEPTDPDESERVEWVALSEIPALLRGGEIGDGLSVVGLLAEIAGI
jgi:8-oxo-dGTP pyrophosphatase MutT (NUDIX family)